MAITISGTTGVAGVDGSASAPATAGTDSNSGIFYGADVIKFSTGGTERMSITNSGVTGAGLFASYAVITNELSAGTEGGTNVANSWATRDLNTELADPDGIVSISSNKFTLGAGSYLIKWMTAFQNASYTITRLYDVTNSAVRQYGMASYGIYTTDRAPGFARVTPSGSTEYRIEYYSDQAQANSGLGPDAPDDVAVTIGTVVEIFKEA